MTRIGIAVVGYGYWGPNLARNFAIAPGSDLVTICDPRRDRLELAKTHHPSVRLSADFDDVLADPRVDAVALATPVSTHFSLGMRALRAGRHVLVEKPLATSSSEVLEMIREAERQHRVLMADHTFVYMGAVRKVKEIIETGALGDLYYFDSIRVNLGLFQRDVSVVWDLAVHDLTILQYWISQRPLAVSCVGVAHVADLQVDLAYVTVYYPDNLIAHIHVNWLSPVKVRRIIVAGSERTIVFDDLNPDEKIKLYSRGVTRQEELVGSSLIPLAYRRTGDIWMPQFDQSEALATVAEHFVHCCQTGTEPVTGGRQGLQVVQLLEAAEQSLRSNGATVTLPSEP